MNNGERCKMYYKSILEKLSIKTASLRSKKPSVFTNILKIASVACELSKRSYCEETNPLPRIKLKNVKHCERYLVPGPPPEGIGRYGGGQEFY